MEMKESSRSCGEKKRENRFISLNASNYIHIYIPDGEDNK
jgi:hypothetical protein